MRELTIRLYTFNELDEKARKKAIDSTREQYQEQANRWDWEDANESIKDFNKIAGTRQDIAFSSQGHSVRTVYDDTSDKSDEENEQMWERLKQKMKTEWKESIWSDYLIRETFEKTEYDKRRSYASNVAWMIASFADKVYSDIAEHLNDEESQANYLEDNNFEFLEDGTKNTIL